MSQNHKSHEDDPGYDWQLEIIAKNVRQDPHYAPYCMRCPGLKRMKIVGNLQWRCDCGAQHDQRHYEPRIASNNW